MIPIALILALPLVEPAPVPVITWEQFHAMMAPHKVCIIDPYSAAGVCYPFDPKKEWRP